jgi:hypothetical protein
MVSLDFDSSCFDGFERTFETLEDAHLDGNFYCNFSPILEF